MIYLTYNDQHSGVYSSQVSDVVNFINHNLNEKITLVSFISVRGFFKNRKKILAEVDDAFVIPIFPRASLPLFSKIVFTLICYFSRKPAVLARNVIATQIALGAKSVGAVSKVGYDGRGAIAAEWNEYSVVESESLKSGIFKAERECVLRSDFRLAVSTKLVEYWRDQFGYDLNSHVVIPCTLNMAFRFDIPSTSQLAKLRSRSGYDDNNIVLIYSGSTAGWQSFGELDKILSHLLEGNKQVRLLFLSKEDEVVKEMIRKFPEQVTCKWVAHEKVRSELLSGDYGILYREATTTNKVAAPTKFAEYLSAGLKVIISDELGDYSNFVREHDCGSVITKGLQEIKAVRHDEKQRLMNLSKEKFTKYHYTDQYKKIIENLRN